MWYIYAEIHRAIFKNQKLFGVIKSLNLYGSSYCGLTIRGNSDLDLSIEVDDLLAD